MLLFTIPTSRTQLNHALACVAIISSSVTAYQLDDKLVSKLGQLLDPYNSDLANVQVGTVLSYGCWCHFDVKLIGGNKTVFLHTKGRGNAVDELDQNCKILASGYRCGVLDADSTCEPWSIPYNQPTDVEDFCHYENHNQVCETNACIVETNFINSLSELVENGVQIDSSQYGHAAGFDDSVCKPEKTTADLSGFEQVEMLEKHQACCGEYPERYLYKTSGSTECCGSETYKNEKFDCCNGEVVLKEEVCEERVSPCASSPCGNGVCRDTVDMLDYNCICDKSFIGKDCVIAQVCHLPELYSSLGFISPCLNDGLCVDLEESEDSERVFDGRAVLTINTNFKCVCTDGYTGLNCESEIEVVEATQEPTTQEPTTQQPTTQQPTPQQPTTQQPTAQEPTTQEPTTQQPTTQQPTTQQPTTQEPTTQQLCGSIPCQNGGVCVMSTDNFIFECDCDETGFSGIDCGVENAEEACSEPFPVYGPNCDLEPEAFALGGCDVDGTCFCDGVGVKNGVAFNDIPNPNFDFCSSAGNSCFCYHYVE